jgi:serine protease Do
LGVGLTAINEQIARYYGLNNQNGVIIQIFADSPAAKAGLRDGDIIKEINRKTIKNPEDVVNIIKTAKVGDKIEILVYREGKLTVFKVQLGEKPQEMQTNRRYRNR